MAQTYRKGQLLRSPAIPNMPAISRNLLTRKSPPFDWDSMACNEGSIAPGRMVAALIRHDSGVALPVLAPPTTDESATL